MVGLVLNSVVTVLHTRESVIFLVGGVLWWVKCPPCGGVIYPCVQCAGGGRVNGQLEKWHMHNTSYLTNKGMA